MTYRFRGFTRFALLILLLGILLAALGAQAQGDNVFRLGTESPVVLDPALHTNDPETALNRAIYDYLVEVLPDSTIGASLATDWTISDDGLTYTFSLVEGAAFHDGKPFTSADVVWTFNRLKDAGSPALNLLGSDFTVAANGDTSVVFTIPAVNADFLYGVGALQALIIPDGQNTPNEIAEGDNPLVNFNGTGPFKLVSFDAGTRAVFEANADYWGGAPSINMEHVYLPDAIAQVNAISTGVVDFIYKVPINQVEQLEALDNVTVLQQATSQHPVIRLRTDAGSLGEDVRVRQAFKFATDRDYLNEVLLGGRGVVGNNDPIAPVFSFFYDGDVENQPYDPDQACALLTEAGMNPVEAALYVPQVFEYVDLATQLQAMWAEGCINVNIEQREAGYYYDVSNPDNYFDVQLGITGWGARPSPQLLLKEAYIESGIPTYYNESRFVDPELEALVAEGSTTADPEARKEIYRQVSAIFRDRGPIIIPYFAPLTGAYTNRVSGLVMAPFPGRTDFRSVTLSS